MAPPGGGVELSTSSLGEGFRNLIGRADYGVHTSFMEGHAFPARAPGGDDPGDPDGPGASGVSFSGAHARSSSLRRELTGRSRREGFPELFPFQVESVVNTVYRPPRIKSTRVMTKPRMSEDGSYVMHTYVDSGVLDLRSDDDDIGMTVVNDLFTGSGKTLVSALGALVFARDRRDAVVRKHQVLQREQTHHSWNTRMTRTRRSCRGPGAASQNPMCADPEFSDVVVIMCPRHLVGQWRRGCEQAMSMLGVRREIVINPRAGGAPREGEWIVIFDSALLLKRSGLRFVPCVVVDEFVTKNPSNVLVRPMEDTPTHGRLILVSADAGSVRRIVFGVNRRSFLRKMVGYDNGDCGYDIDSCMEHSIVMMSTAVLPTAERKGVRDTMARRMSEIPYEEYRVGYTPTLSSRLFGANFEMSAASGRQMLLDRFGIDVESATSVGDIVRSIDERLRTMRDHPDPRVSVLESLGGKLRGFAEDDDASCPICLESFEQASRASVLNPCWHIFCDKCVTTLMRSGGGSRCPMCRSEIEGHTTAAISAPAEESRRASRPARESVEQEKGAGTPTFLERVEGSTSPSMGLEEACMSVLRCVEEDARGASSCYRVIMVVPDDHFFLRFSGMVAAGFEPGRVETIRFNTAGNKRKRVTTGSLEVKMERFASDEGAPLKILFTTEGRTDSLTGLDFPGVDCLVSVGSGNSIQRLGRLTRVSRFARSGGATPGRAVRSISLSPRM